MSNGEIIILSGIEEMSEFLVSLIGEKISAASESKPVNIALSGGSTPKLIFENIVLLQKEKVKWDRIRFFQVDERCVPPDDMASNYRMIRLNLLKGINFPEDCFFRMRGEDDPEEEATRYGKIVVENLPEAGKWPVFDLILLGLGEDGHTASLFPGGTGVMTSRNCCEVTVHPQTGQKRITLTLPVLNQAKQLVFVVTGRDKAGIVSEIILNPDKNRYPASRVNPEQGKLTWLLDAEAASGLPSIKAHIPHGYCFLTTQ